MKKKLVSLVILIYLVTVANASERMHKIVFQVSTNDPLTQKIALNNAQNAQKAYGKKNVKIEIVGYGPGLSLLMVKNEYAQRVKKLIKNGIRFSACMNSIKAFKKKHGKYPKLIEGVVKVKSGVMRLNDLQEQGYSYIRP